MALSLASASGGAGLGLGRQMSTGLFTVLGTVAFIFADAEYSHKLEKHLFLRPKFPHPPHHLIFLFESEEINNSPGHFPEFFAIIY